ncbi:hypothetical protein HZS_1269, partial [Henneguya salminicola]
MRGLSFAFTDENETDVEENTQDNNNDGNFLVFPNAEVLIVNNQRVGRFCQALSGEGIAISADDVDFSSNYNEPAPTTAVLSEEEIIESVQVKSGLSEDSNDKKDAPAEDINNSRTRLPTAADSLRTALAWRETQN